MLDINMNKKTHTCAANIRKFSDTSNYYSKKNFHIFYVEINIGSRTINRPQLYVIFRFN